MSKKIKWREEGSTGSTFVLKTDNLRIVVTRRFGLAGWFLFVRVLGIEEIELSESDLEAAQREALIITRKRIEQLTREFNKATGEI